MKIPVSTCQTGNPCAIPVFVAIYSSAALSKVAEELTSGSLQSGISAQSNAWAWLKRLYGSHSGNGYGGNTFISKEAANGVWLLDCKSKESYILRKMQLLAAKSTLVTTIDMSIARSPSTTLSDSNLTQVYESVFLSIPSAKSARESRKCYINYVHVGPSTSDRITATYAVQRWAELLDVDFAVEDQQGPISDVGSTLKSCKTEDIGSDHMAHPVWDTEVVHPVPLMLLIGAKRTIRIIDFISYIDNLSLELQAGNCHVQIEAHDDILPNRIWEIFHMLPGAEQSEFFRIPRSNHDRPQQLPPFKTLLEEGSTMPERPRIAVVIEYDDFIGHMARDNGHVSDDLGGRSGSALPLDARHKASNLPLAPFSSRSLAAFGNRRKLIRRRKIMASVKELQFLFLAPNSILQEHQNITLHVVVTIQEDAELNHKDLAR
ncbi:hypothetical protein K437DRAFT_265508 [Tilletiaria anomala UBC 951]|uniref:Uncharacterized protein n=1 Tax=Tilletiaria anomala (strain ATCC 24038 / CBS 436.72 / UBC 951) TaxID=1037660 RepID=A0A066V4S9_TILAU|nr:uncharacterized protein K437DRAFT_265508 [Tilletiaria anomala UBC 951]KDN35238.1 hypothetical protein K437DRAFT_265508 [Tilletiaria anomala UBC 951]